MNVNFITIGAALALVCLGCSTPRDQGVRSDEIMQAVERFAADCGHFPTTAEGLASLIRNPGVPGWNGPYWEGDFRDRWGTVWCYTNVDYPTVYSPGGGISLARLPASY
jgi:hypothetical protein